MTEAEIKLEARFMALERFACHTHNMALKIFGRLSAMSVAEINELEAQSLEQLRMLPVQGQTAEVSDVLSDETFQDLKRLISYARGLRGTEPG